MERAIVSTRRFGRLGNELFQYAAVLGYAKMYGTDFSFPRRSNDPVWNPTHMPHLYNPNWVEGREDFLINEIWDENRQYMALPFREEMRGKQIVLNGYWQDFRYYDFCLDFVRETFAFPWRRNTGYCSIHVRRGDYLLYPTKHPVVTPEYLKKAIRHIIDETGVKKFKVFSDDIQWCINAGLPYFFPSCEFEYSVGQTEVDDLVEMSCCEHNIISNSTMSWWAAELNQNQRKVVVIPSKKNWFGPDNKLLVDGLYRESHVQIEYA